MTIIISVFVPERSRAGTNPRFQFLYQSDDRPGTKTEIIIVKVSSEENTFSVIGCKDGILFEMYPLQLYNTLSDCEFGQTTLSQHHFVL